MEIQTDITKQDWVEFSYYHYRESATAKSQFKKAVQLNIAATIFCLVMFFLMEAVI